MKTFKEFINEDGAAIGTSCSAIAGTGGKNGSGPNSGEPGVSSEIQKKRTKSPLLATFKRIFPNGKISK